MRLLTISLTAGISLAPSPGLAEQAGSSLVGTWTLDLEQSVPPQGKVFRPFTLLIRESSTILDFTQLTSDAGGNTVEFSHRTPADGVVRDLSGMPGARAAFMRLPSGVIDARL